MVGKTAVLFISHLVNQEMMFRYNHLKKGCDELGYDLFWAMDSDSSQKDELPFNIKKFEFSYSEFEKKFPFMVFFPERKFNMTPSVPNLFQLKNGKTYDYLWVIEYDVCCYGDWYDFFWKYDNNDSDLITSKPKFKTYEQQPKWQFWRKYLRKDIKKFLADEKKVLCGGLMCCSRLSSRLVDKIWDFHNQFKSKTMFFEIVWPSVAKMNSMKIELFDSPWFVYKPELTQEFNEFNPGEVFHPVKEYIKWEKVLSWKNYLNSDN